MSKTLAPTTEEIARGSSRSEQSESGQKASPSPSVQGKPARWWIKAFVIFHVIAITVYTMPFPNGNLQSGRVKPYGSDWIIYENWKYAKSFPPIQSYILATGFWQYWDMFAPDPVQSDQYCTADVIYQDGTKREYQYPRMYLLPIPEKFLQERYRKFFERAHETSSDQSKGQRGFVRQRFAQRIALINDVLPHNPPVEVKLFLHTMQVPPPRQPLKLDYKKEQYFDYIVDQDLLAQDKSGLR